MRHTITVLVENHFGVLARVSGLFSARGYNIDSLCVGETDNPAISRMTVVVQGDDRVVHQIINQLNKLVDTIEVRDLTHEDHVQRELVMLKIAVDSEHRGEVIEIANIFRAKVVDVGTAAMILEVTGSNDKTRAFIDTMRPYGIQELVRTGNVAIERSPKAEYQTK
jgi:acetolactate synthase I/III small subunit